MSGTASSSTPANSATTPASAAPRVTAAPLTITVCQYNVHKAIGSDGKTNEARIGDALVKLNADVYSLNEVYFYYGAHNTIDQLAYWQNYLHNKTGQPWSRVALNFLGLGTVKGYGIGMLTRLPIRASSRQLLVGTQGIIRIDVGTPALQCFSMHCDYYAAAERAAQIKQALAFAAPLKLPHALMGDCNCRPDTTDYKLFTAAQYRDGWREAVKQGAGTAWNGSGNTHGYGTGSRFDYCWLKGLATVVKATVPDMRVGGVWPSDHHPLVMTLSL